MRFKIDLNDYSFFPFGLYVMRGVTFFRRRPIWHQVETFKTREEAKAHYELIKDLPEYLA